MLNLGMYSTDIADLFQPIEDCIRNDFIPALVGRAVSDDERMIFSLPTKFGGLNIPDPTKLCSKEYEWSKKLNSSLTEKVIQQNLYDQECPEVIKERHGMILGQSKAEKKTIQKSIFNALYEGQNEEMKRSLDLASEKGASIWLNTLPIKSLGYSLNNQEFRDAIAL